MRFDLHLFKCKMQYKSIWRYSETQGRIRPSNHWYNVFSLTVEIKLFLHFIRNVLNQNHEPPCIIELHTDLFIWNRLVSQIVIHQNWNKTMLWLSLSYVLLISLSEMWFLDVPSTEKKPPWLWPGECAVQCSITVSIPSFQCVCQFSD